MAALVTHPAPDFTASAVLPDGSITDEFRLSSSIDARYAVLVFYPLDFTFVCPSELIALDHRLAAFRERNVEVFAISIDSQFTHSAWRRTAVEDGGIGEVGFTMIADVKHEICRAYGVEHGDGVALRASFLIDREGIVRSEMINDLPLGRNIDEMLRLVDALQFHEEHGEVCPAGWTHGKPGMAADAEGVSQFLAKHGASL